MQVRLLSVLASRSTKRCISKTGIGCQRASCAQLTCRDAKVCLTSANQALMYCTAAATPSSASRAKKREYDDEEEEESEEDEKPKPKKRQTKKPKEVIEVSSELQDFWTAHPPSLLYRCAACCRQLLRLLPWFQRCVCSLVLLSLASCLK